MATARLVDAIADSIPAIGTDEFTARFLQVVKFMGAGQVTAFAYEPTKASCILSRHFLSAATGGVLTAAYLDGWFRDDPLFKRAMALRENDYAVERLEDLLSALSSRYLTRFISSAGFQTKVAVLIAQGPLRMVLNLYFEKDIPEPHDEAKVSMYRLLAKTLAAHFQQASSTDVPMSFAALSERERQVCIGMLAGKKVEMIAEEIGIGPSSVVTYRQRAYQKLGISSRGQLFSIWRTWHPQQRTEAEAASIVAADT